MELRQNHLIIIAGPTAVGKTALSFALANRYECPIISADSRQIYRQMSIGTAKPSSEELSRHQHHFINHLDIEDSYSAGQYEREARALIKDLWKHHQVLIVCGGTGLYLRALMEGLDDFPDIPDAIMAQLETDLQTVGLEALQLELKTSDPHYADSVDLSNRRRVLRALAVIRYTSRPFSEYLSGQVKSHDFVQIPILLTRDKKELHERIHARVDEMIEQGLLEEVKSLLPHRNLRALQTVGYQELFEHLDGLTKWEEAIAKIKTKTRQYAKRQMTWFRKYGDWKKYHPTHLHTIMRDIDHIINQSSYDLESKT